MKKYSAVPLVCILFCSLAFRAGAQARGPVDLVLVLDTSASMSASFQKTAEYITGAFLRENLLMGDTFHLISFAGEARLELARRIRERGDLETVIGRMLLLYPLEPYTDIAGALAYTDAYLAGLPPGRPKKVVLLSDGEHNPPGGGGAGLDAAAQVTALSARLGRAGGGAEFVPVSRLPLAAVPPATAPAVPPPSAPSPVAPAVSPATAPVAPPPAIPAAPPASSPAVPPPSAPSPATPAAPPATAPVAPPSPAAPSPAMPAAPPAAPAAPPATAPAAPPAASAPPPAAPSPAVPSPAVPAAPPATAPAVPPSSAPSPAVPAAPPAAAPAVPPPSALSPAVPAAPPASSPAVPPPSAPATAAPPVSPPPPSGAGAGRAETPRPRPAAASVTGENPFAAAAGSPLVLAGIGVILTVLLAFMIYLLTRRLRRSPNRILAGGAGTERREAPARRPESPGPARRENSPPPAPDRRPRGDLPPRREEAPRFRGEPVMLSLFVEDQNTAIGRRNIHLLKQGYSLSIGGGKSDFLIFLVPLPPAIAEIRYNGRSCDLIPRKPQYFPDLGSSELANCIGETVRVVSDKRYELRFRFELYEDPLQALNRLLTSVGSAEKSGGPAPAATTGDSDSPRRRPPAPPVNGGRLL